MDDINTFIRKIEIEFDELKEGSLKSSMGYKDIEGWSSMKALILIATVDSEYGVMLKGEDLSRAKTLQDIYDIVVSKTKTEIA